MFTNTSQPPCPIYGSIQASVRLRPSSRHHREILPPGVQKIPKDEAERINQDEIKTDVFAKEEIETDGFDLTERSGRAVKVSSQVTFIFIYCFTFVCIYLD